MIEKELVAISFDAGPLSMHHSFDISLGDTYLDRIPIGLCDICFGAVNVNADRGTSKLGTRGRES